MVELGRSGDDRGIDVSIELARIAVAGYGKSIVARARFSATGSTRPTNENWGRPLRMRA